MEAITNNMEFFKELVTAGDFKSIYKLAKELDAKGVAEGTLILSKLYHTGYGVKQNFKKEVKLLRKALKMGSQEARFNFAMAYATGAGVKQNTYKAMSMIEQLAEEGFEPAIDFLEEEECDCEVCQSHRGCGAGNLVKCGESLDVVMKRFTTFINAGDFATAFELATELHEMEIANGTYALSIFYHNGNYVAQDFKKEVELLQIAAEQAFEPAIFNLALAISLGKGIEQDAELGFEMMVQLADDGYEDAIELLDAMAA